MLVLMVLGFHNNVICNPVAFFPTPLKERRVSAIHCICMKNSIKNIQLVFFFPSFVPRGLSALGKEPRVREEKGYLEEIVFISILLAKSLIDENREGKTKQNKMLSNVSNLICRAVLLWYLQS